MGAGRKAGDVVEGVADPVMPFPRAEDRAAMCASIAAGKGPDRTKRARPQQNERRLVLRPTVALLRLTMRLPGFVMHVRNEFGSKVGRGAQAQALLDGILPGAPDLLLFYQQRVMGLELKYGSNSLSDSQKIARKKFGANGFLVFEAHSMEEALEFAANEDFLIPNWRAVMEREIARSAD